MLSSQKRTIDAHFPWTLRSKSVFFKWNIFQTKKTIEGMRTTTNIICTRTNYSFLITRDQSLIVFQNMPLVELIEPWLRKLNILVTHRHGKNVCNPLTSCFFE